MNGSTCLILPNINHLSFITQVIQVMYVQTRDLGLFSLFDHTLYSLGAFLTPFVWLIDNKRRYNNECLLLLHSSFSSPHFHFLRYTLRFFSLNRSTGLIPTFFTYLISS